MSFRTYSPNPTLQRLRILNESDLDRVFASQRPAQDYVSFTMDAYEKHTISDYGSLAAPHSFAEATHEHRRVRRRRSSAAALSRFSMITQSKDSDDQKEGSGSHGHKTDVPQPGCSAEGGKEGGGADPKSNLPMSPQAQDEETHLTPGAMITGRPVFVLEDEGIEDLDESNAVILRAKWEKLSRATPRKVRLQRQTIKSADA